MKYDPKSANSSLIPDGEYDIEIAEAEDTESKTTGKDMIKITTRVWAGGGGPRIVFDYVVNPDSLWKLKQIAGAIGKQELFDSGEMGAAEIEGASLRATIKTQKGKNGFEDKNVIARYLPVAAGEPRAEHRQVPAGDDDIPF